MCHLVLFLPVFALPVFWLLPWPEATGIYAVVLGLSAWLYYVVVKMMHRPSVIGSHTLIGRCGTVVQSEGCCGLARIGRELWRIESTRDLNDHDPVTVTGRRGLVLQVSGVSAHEPPPPGSAPPQT